MLGMKPVVGHLVLKQERSPFAHLTHTVTEKRYRLPFLLVMLLPTGGYMLMPFGTAYMVNNIGIAFSHLPTIYLITGLFTIFVGPVVGRISDTVGKFNTFLAGSILSTVMVLIWTNLGHTPLWGVIVVNVLLFIGIFSRIIPSQALISAVPEPSKRGAFNAINASLQQFAGAFSASIAGAVIVENADGTLQHFNWLGYLVIAVLAVTVTLMYFLHKSVPERIAPSADAVAVSAETVA
jgi:predicted MFS family arabinose efflux permease